VKTTRVSFGGGAFALNFNIILIFE